MRIAMLVQGRFWIFEMARALMARNHYVKVFTNYPIWAARRFGLPAENVGSFWPHGILTRAIEGIASPKLSDRVAPALHQMFGRWAAEQVQDDSWDVIHGLSGIVEESLRKRSGRARHVMVRASAHIRVQEQLLREEFLRCGTELQRPSKWIIEREEREYQAADRIAVVSRFVYQSFLNQGIPEQKLALLLLGVDTRAFRPSLEALERRRQRILAGEPLNVLYTGVVSFRKGLYDLARIVRTLSGNRFRFRLVGSIPPEASAFVKALGNSVECVPHQPQSQLPAWYAQSDLFIFPTIEDGFPAVLAQAHANALPILTTTNCSGPDIINEGDTGWVLPVRSPEAFIDRLRWCDSHRSELAEMVYQIFSRYRPRDWADVAVDFEKICLAA